MLALPDQKFHHQCLQGRDAGWPRHTGKLVLGDVTSCHHLAKRKGSEAGLWFIRGVDDLLIKGRPTVHFELKLSTIEKKTPSVLSPKT